MPFLKLKLFKSYSLSLSHLYSHNANNTCLPCHSFCSGSCVGEVQVV